MAWPKGKPRGPRAATAIDPNAAPEGAGLGSPPPRAVSPARSGNTPISGRAVTVGRSGEELSRTRPVNSDVYDVPKEIVPQGWDYQWNPVEVLGKPLSAIEANIALAMHQNGWRDVPADRHPGRFMPLGHKGAIIRDSLVLQERPMALTLEARAEELTKARAQVNDQIAQLGLSEKLPPGFSRDNSRLRAMERQQTRTTYEPAPDAPRPQLPIDPT